MKRDGLGNNRNAAVLNPRGAHAGDRPADDEHIRGLGHAAEEGADEEEEEEGYECPLRVGVASVSGWCYCTSM